MKTATARDIMPRNLLTLLLTLLLALPASADMQYEDDGFVWDAVTQGSYMGVKNEHGRWLINPDLRFTRIVYSHPESAPSGYFKVYKGEKEGIYTIHGKEVIPAKYNCIFYSSNGFMWSDSWDLDAANYDFNITLDSDGVAHGSGLEGQRGSSGGNSGGNSGGTLHKEDDGFKWYSVTQGSYVGAKTENGRWLINPDQKFTRVEYSHPESAPSGFFKVYKGKKEGVYTIHGKEIIPATYNCIFYSSNGFMWSESWDLDADNHDFNIRLDRDGNASGSGLRNTGGNTSGSRPTTNSGSRPTTNSGTRIGAFSTEIISDDGFVQERDGSSPTGSAAATPASGGDHGLRDQYPEPLRQGRYTLISAYTDSEQTDIEGYVYYNASNGNVSIVFNGNKATWPGTTYSKKDGDSGRYLIYTDTENDVLLLSNKQNNADLFILGFTSDGTTLLLIGKRSSFRSMTPSQITQALNAVGN